MKPKEKFNANVSCPISAVHISPASQAYNNCSTRPTIKSAIGYKNNA
jgi:hypothetical protein